METMMISAHTTSESAPITFVSVTGRWPPWKVSRKA